MSPDPRRGTGARTVQSDQDRIAFQWPLSGTRVRLRPTTADRECRMVIPLLERRSMDGPEEYGAEEKQNEPNAIGTLSEGIRGSSGLWHTERRETREWVQGKTNSRTRRGRNVRGAGGHAEDWDGLERERRARSRPVHRQGQSLAGLSEKQLQVSIAAEVCVDAVAGM